MLEAIHKGVVGVAASEVCHGADGLWVVVRLSRVVETPVVWYPGWWFPGVRDLRQVVEVCVHVVLQRRVFAFRHVFRKLVVGVFVYVSVAQAVPMGLLFDEV